MSHSGPLVIESLQNTRVKGVIKLRQRSHRDERDELIIEGYRELKRAVENGVRPKAVYYSEAHFQGGNEPALLDRCRAAGAEIVACSAAVFEKMSYRDRPEGLLAVAPQQHRVLADLSLPDRPLLIVAESIEKPGNLGTILRSADAAGAHGVIVCDRCTDLNNPNVVRASIGTLFSVPVAEATTAETIAWLRAKSIRIVAATPHTDTEYYDADFRQGVAIVVGTEQYGLSREWLDQADLNVRIPMRGQADSLNVSAATTILLFEAVRQRAQSARG